MKTIISISKVLPTSVEDGVPETMQVYSLKLIQSPSDSLSKLRIFIILLIIIPKESF